MNILKHLWFLALLTLAGPSWSAVHFARAFAPQEGLVAPCEKPWRGEMCLNAQWQFQPVALPAGYDVSKQGPPALPPPTPGGWSATPIRIPSPWNVNSFTSGAGGDFRDFPSYPAAWDKAEMGWLRRTFSVPAAWHGQRLFLHFEAVAGDCQVFVNGKKLADHFDSFLPFEVDVTGAVHAGRTNTLLLGVRKPDLFDVPGPLGSYTYPTGSFWGGHVVGVWQDVFLEARPALRVENVAVRPLVKQGVLELAVTVRNDTAAAKTCALTAQVQPWVNRTGKDVLSAPEPRWTLGPPVLKTPAAPLTVAAGQSQTVVLRQPVRGRLALWTLDAPRLYGLTVSLQSGPQVTDRDYERFGWRQWSIAGKQFLLNGKPVQLHGDAWHFMGVPEMTRRYAWAWFRMLKDANANAVRLHAEPYPRFFLDMADQMGIAVLDESAIWASHCNFNYDAPQFWPRARQHVADLVLRDRNHASVFGWSVANEIQPALGVKNASADVRARVTGQIVSIAQMAGALDPTRPWISSDGDQDMEGRLPVFVEHYGDPAGWAREAAQADKPFAVGEASSAYYGTPKDESQFNGDRAYASMEGRMEALAIECYAEIQGQRPVAAYSSVFNLAWYSLKPLALGQPDTRRAPTLADGIVFGPYVEGQPGMQPERLGSYCTTLNPGYDPHLPLYEPWPMWNAIKAANAPGGPTPSPWDHKPVLVPLPSPPPATIPTVAFLGAPKGQLEFLLETLGAPVQAASPAQAPAALVVDGATLTPAQVPNAKRQLSAVLAAGGTALVWDATPATAPLVSELLPSPVTLTDRSASSLLGDRADPMTASISLADLYFSEDNLPAVLAHGLAGPLVDQGHALLWACPTDWRKWNGQGEDVKTAAVLRSEREAQPSGAALVEARVPQGRLLVTSLPPAALSARYTLLLRRLVGNMGVVLGPMKPSTVAGFDAAGFLHQALCVGSFAGTAYPDVLDADDLGGEASAAPKAGDAARAGDAAGGLAWHPVTAGADGVFDFLKMRLPGPTQNCAAYLSFWLDCPQPLNQLLARPDVPTITLEASSDDGMKVWLNGKQILEDRGRHPVDMDHPQNAPLPLAQGWNHLLIKVGQDDGQWQFAARLESSDPHFLTTLRAAPEPPAMQP